MSDWPKDVHEQYLRVLDERDNLQEHVDVLEREVKDLRACLAAYRSAVLSGEPESDQLRSVYMMLNHTRPIPPSRMQ